MKKFILPLIIGLLVISTILFAQTTRTTGIKFEYCDFIWNSTRLLNGSRSVSGFIELPDGSSEEFNKSRGEGLNYLGAQGWELRTSFIREGDGWTEYIYTFQRTK